MRRTPAEALSDVIRHMRPLNRRLTRLAQAQLQGTGLRLATRAVLEHLGEAGARTVPQIARAAGLPRQPVQRAVDDLIARGLAERAVNDAHRRSCFIVLTEAGRALFGTLEAREHDLMARMACSLDPLEIETARRIMARLARDLRAARG